ncbi:MAG: molybdenum cofactor biosynthesis protein MoaE [Nitrospirota bacterium]
MSIRIQSGDFSIEEEIGKMKGLSLKIGGIVTFLGTARDFSKGQIVTALSFEHYPKMAEETLRKIREKALTTFDIAAVTMIHRVGNIQVGENIVLIVVGAEHRKAAFDACSWCIDELKKTVPIWKREETQDGKIWVHDRP